MHWIEGIHWRKDIFRGKQQYLADNFEYRYYAKSMGYGSLDLSKIPAIRLYLTNGNDTFGAWMKANPEYIPTYGFSNSDQICCFASIHFQKIASWCKNQGGIVPTLVVELPSYVDKLVNLSKRLEKEKGNGWIKAADIQKSFNSKNAPSADVARSWMKEASALGIGITKGMGNKLEYCWQSNSICFPIDNLDLLR